MSNIGMRLQGRFKFDLLDAKGNLLESSDFVDNFITNSGVLYPYHFAFADCFRFLSVGTGNNPNSILKNTPFSETTGLSSGISAYSYIGSRPNLNAAGNNYSSYPSCGYSFSQSGVTLIRQWTLPDNSGDLFQNSGMFNEFVVSPGRPYVTGADRVPLCSCSEVSAGRDATGLDCSTVAEYYNWVNALYRGQEKKLKICDAPNAFARVIYPVNYVSGSILNITYALNIGIDTGVNFKSMYYNNTRNTHGNWSGTLNAIFNITQPGIKLINDGNVTISPAPGANRLQHYDYGSSNTYSFTNEYGESFVPPHGIPLEPSQISVGNDARNQNIVYYLSTDGSQFLVNPSGGGFAGDTGQFAPWNLWQSGTTYSQGNIAYSGSLSYQYIGTNPSAGNLLTNTTYWQSLGYLNKPPISNSGLRPYVNDDSAAIINNPNYWSANPGAFNIRINAIDPSGSNILDSTGPSTYPYFVSPARNNPNFGLVNIANNYQSGARTGQVFYTFNFQNYGATANMPVKSLVGAYKDLSYGAGDTTNYVPFFDVLFSGTGSVFIPTIQTGVDVNGFTGVSLSGVDSQDYFYLYYSSNAVYPIFNSILRWSVPCPGGTIGC